MREIRPQDIELTEYRDVLGHSEWEDFARKYVEFGQVAEEWVPLSCPNMETAARYKLKEMEAAGLVRCTYSTPPLPTDTGDVIARWTFNFPQPDGGLDFERRYMLTPKALDLLEAKYGVSKVFKCEEVASAVVMNTDLVAARTPEEAEEFYRGTRNIHKTGATVGVSVEVSEVRGLYGPDGTYELRARRVRMEPDVVLG